MSRRNSAKWIALAVVLLVILGAGLLLVARLRTTNLTLAFTREDLQKRVAAKFPFDQKLLFITVTYSNPEVILNDSSDRIGISLDATARLAGDQLVKGHAVGDWQIRYEPAEGAFYFDDPKIERIDIGGLTPSTQEQISRIARPLMEEYLRRVPVYRLKPGDFRQDLARATLKSVAVRQGKLYVVLGPG